MSKAALTIPVIGMLLLTLLPKITLATQTVVINEILAHPSSGNDWVEIYNPTSSSVDLTGYSIYDDTSSMKTLSSTIAPGGFVTFDVSNRLNNSGDQVHLKDANNTDLDSYTYTNDPGVDMAIGRYPDGGSFASLSPTKGASNNNATLFSATPTPTPTASSTNPTATPSPSPTSTPTTSLTVSGIPSSIASTDVFSATVNLISPSNPTTTFYLKGAFYTDGSINYFGQTLVSGAWVKNSSSFSNQLKITTDSTGSWSGLIQVMPDISDSGYKGSGSYNFKVARYTSTGDLSWSNSSAITISGSATSASSSSTGIGGYTADQATSSATLSTAQDQATGSANLITPDSEATPSGEATVSGIRQEKLTPPSSKLNFFLFLSGGALLLLGGFYYLLKLNILRLSSTMSLWKLLQKVPAKLLSLRKILPLDF